MTRETDAQKTESTSLSGAVKTRVISLSGAKRTRSTSAAAARKTGSTSELYSVLVCKGHADMLVTLFLMLMLSDECHVTLICAVGSCSEGTCQHPRSTKWVQCEVCGDWYHCLCENVDRMTAEQDRYVFYCILCKLE